MKEIGMVIRERRLEKDMTLKQLANKIGITSSALCMIETGERIGKLETLECIAIELGFKRLSFLIALAEDMRSLKFKYQSYSKTKNIL